MKNRKRISAYLLVMMLVLLMVACGKKESGESADAGQDTAVVPDFTETELTEKEFAPTSENVRIIGRAQVVDDTLWLVHSGSGAEFIFKGTSAAITMKPDSALNSGMDSQTRIAIYVNGERVVDEMVDKLEKTYTVFESEEAQECTIRVVKLSEAANSTAGIASIEVTSMGNIYPTTESERYIEFIGDSITCGYGVDDENRDHHFSTRTEDVTKTYAYKTAQALGADYSMVSFSGYGIISGYSGNGEQQTAQQLPQYYEKLGFSYGAYMGQYYPQDMAWDFSVRQPDVIVINLGTNDNSYVKGNAEKEAAYEEAYVEFLKVVRSNNPEAAIVCTLGIMGAELYPSVERAVEAYQAETGDTNVYAMQFDAQSANDGYAADWHPTEVTHTKAAEKLVIEIQNIMEW